MSTTSQTPKKRHNKPPKSRPLATSSISQPAVEDSWSSTVLSVFSPDAQLFAFLSLAVDKHRLRVFDPNTGQSIAEHIVDQSRVTSLAWISLNATGGAVPKKRENLPSRKRKKLNNVPDESNQPSSSSDWRVEQAIALGLSDGRVQVFSVERGCVVKTLSEATSKSAVLAVTGNRTEGGSRSLIWASSSDGNLRLWDVSSAEVLFSTQGEGSQYSALAVRPGFDKNQMHILAANSTIRLLSFSSGSISSDDSGLDDLDQICTFGGHASTCKSVLWEHSSSQSRRFYSSAEDDRFIYLWEVPELPSSKGDLIASCPLEADVLHIDSFSVPSKKLLLALTSSGKVALFSVPNDLEGRSIVTDKDTKRNIPSLRPHTVIRLAERAAANIRIASATFLRDDPGKVRVVLVSGGVKVAFETLRYFNDVGEFIPDVTVKPSASAFSPTEGTNGTVISNKRYSESSGLAVATGADTPHDPSIDALADREVDGLLNENLAELSLGQRLAARSDGLAERRIPPEPSTGNNAEDARNIKTSSPEQRRPQDVQVPVHSLTRTLIQALHAGDTSLLEACLTHSDESLVHSTVARLPSQLAVPLLTTCVERLGRGPRGNNIKGRGGGASAQRGLSLMKWVRAVLVIHSGHLMAMPDLVARLSHLHSTLSTRLALQERLLSLSGRLDLVLAQAELRSSNAPAPLSSKKTAKKREKKAKEPIKYIEGESSEEETEEEEMQVEVEEDEGSVEDVELDEDSDQDDDEDDWDSEEDDESDDANLLNGSVDEESEGVYDEDSWEEDSD